MVVALRRGEAFDTDRWPTSCQPCLVETVVLRDWYNPTQLLRYVGIFKSRHFLTLASNPDMLWGKTWYVLPDLGNNLKYLELAVNRSILILSTAMDMFGNGSMKKICFYQTTSTTTSAKAWDKTFTKAQVTMSLIHMKNPSEFLQTTHRNDDLATPSTVYSGYHCSSEGSGA
jgi:hypothetical protein